MENPKETENGADAAPAYVEYLNRRLSASGHQLDNICLQVTVAIENKKGEFVDAKKWQEMYNRLPIVKHRLFKHTINSSQKQFTAFRLHYQNPNFSALIFQNGSMMIVGVKDKERIIDCVKMTTLHLADAINKNVMLTKVQTVNIVASFSLSPLNFTNLQFFLNNNSVPFIHNPHTFPGLFIKVMIPKHTIPEGQSIFDFYHTHNQVQDYRMITVLVFQGGKAVILGTQGRQDWHVAHEMITALFEKVSAQSFNAKKLERNRIDYNKKIKIKIFKEEGVSLDPASQQVVKEELFYDEDEDFDVPVNSHQPKTPSLTWFTKVCFLLGGKRGKEQQQQQPHQQHYFDHDEDKDYNNLYRDLGHDLKDSQHQLNKTIACINSLVRKSRLFDDKTLVNQSPCSLQNEMDRVIFPNWWHASKTKLPQLTRIVTFGVKEKPITPLKNAPFNSLPTAAAAEYCSCLTTDGGLTVTYTLCKPLSCLQKLANLNPLTSTFEERARNIQYHHSQRFVEDLNSADNVWSLRLISSCPQCCLTTSSKRPVVIPTPDGLGVWRQKLDLVFLNVYSKTSFLKNQSVGKIPYVSHLTPLYPDKSHFPVSYSSSSKYYAEIPFLELNSFISSPLFSPVLKHVEQDVVVTNRPSPYEGVVFCPNLNRSNIKKNSNPQQQRSSSSSGVKYLHGNRFLGRVQKKNNEEETTGKMLRMTYDLLANMMLKKHQAERAINVNMIAEFLKTSACVVAKSSGCKFKASQHTNNISNDDDDDDDAAPFSSELDEDFGSGNMFRNFVNDDSAAASKKEGGDGEEEEQQQDREIRRGFSKRISPAHIHFQSRDMLNKLNRRKMKHGNKAKQNKRLQSQMESAAAAAANMNPDSNNFSELYGLITVLNKATMDDTGVIDFGSYSIDINHIKNVQEFLSQPHMLYAPFQNYRQKYRVSMSMRNNCKNLLNDHAEQQQYKLHQQKQIEQLCRFQTEHSTSGNKKSDGDMTLQRNNATDDEDEIKDEDEEMDEEEDEEEEEEGVYSATSVAATTSALVATMAEAARKVSLTKVVSPSIEPTTKKDLKRFEYEEEEEGDDEKDDDGDVWRPTNKSLLKNKKKAVAAKKTTKKTAAAATAATTTDDDPTASGDISKISGELLTGEWGNVNLLKKAIKMGGEELELGDEDDEEEDEADVEAAAAAIATTSSTPDTTSVITPSCNTNANCKLKRKLCCSCR